MRQVYRYYCLGVSPMPGTVPPGVIGLEDYTESVYCPQIEGNAWGHVDYETPLTENQIKHYDLSGPEVRV